MHSMIKVGDLVTLNSEMDSENLGLKFYFMKDPPPWSKSAKQLSISVEKDVAYLVLGMWRAWNSTRIIYLNVLLPTLQTGWTCITKFDVEVL